MVIKPKVSTTLKKVRTFADDLNAVQANQNKTQTSNPSGVKDQTAASEKIVTTKTGNKMVAPLPPVPHADAENKSDYNQTKIASDITQVAKETTVQQGSQIPSVGGGATSPPAMPKPDKSNKPAPAPIPNLSLIHISEPTRPY